MKDRDKKSNKDEPADDDLRADRESNHSQGSWVGGGDIQPMLSAERLKDAFTSDPEHDAKHDSSWRTHKIEEDERPDEPGE